MQANTLHPTRRVFMLQATTACLACPAVLAQTTNTVDEASETAVALGYRHDTAKVDKAKFPKHQASQTCANCQFWQAKPTDAWSNCAMFGRKAQVANRGWCAAWAKAPG